MSFAVPPVSPAMAALAADLGVALQAGTVVDALVLQILDSNLVRIAIAGLKLDVMTVTPMQQGQTLQLAIAQTANGLTLTPVNGDAAASSRSSAVIVEDIPLAPRTVDRFVRAEPALTPQETQTVAVATETAVTRQAGLSPLFADLSAAVASGALPQPVLIAAAQLLGLRLSSDTELTGSAIKAAMQSSGLTMEASLATTPDNPPPDMKSTLLMLRQTLTTWLAREPDTAPPSQGSIAGAPLPAATRRDLQEAKPQPSPVADLRTMAALQALGSAADGGEPVVTAKNLLVAQLLASVGQPRHESEQQVPASQSVPPPFRGAAPVAQAVAAPTLRNESAPATVARQLLAETEGALARQTLLQTASLPERIDFRSPSTDPTQPRWNFEIPFVTPHGTAMAQFEIARDGGGNQIEATQRIWRARFSLDIEPAGPIHALIAYSGEATSVKMWAERPATAAQLRAKAFQLTQSLDRAELQAGDIIVADGAPPRGKVASGRFLSRAT